MAKEVVNFLTEEELLREVIKYKIQNNLFTKEDYDNMSIEEQNLVKEVLFEMYAQNINPYPALSGLEFGLFALAKIFLKHLDGINLTPAEQEFLTVFRNIIESHELTLNVNDWYIQYLQAVKTQVELNRQEYKQKKLEITGSF